MRKEIKEIFINNRYLLNNIKKVTNHFHVQNFDKALRSTIIMIEKLYNVFQGLDRCIDYFNTEEEVIYDHDGMMSLLNLLLDAQESRNWVLLADLYELHVYPFLVQIQQKIILSEEYDYNTDDLIKTLDAIDLYDKNLSETLRESKDAIQLMEEGYLVEYTSTGSYTLGVVKEDCNYYFHSNHNLGYESYLLAESWYKNDKTNYVIYGLGFGYPMFELLNLDDSITIEVYESDLNIIKLACTFIPLYYFMESNRIKIIYDPKFYRLKNRLKKIGQEDEFLIFYPSLQTIKDMEYKKKLEDYFVQYSSIQNQHRNLIRNFNRNIKLEDPSVESLLQEWEGKDIYIVAAGPSLDKNYMELKNRPKSSVLLATGTVFHKLMKAGIRPDYVIVTDANNRIYKQVVGLEESGVPLIYLSTTFWKIPDQYKGKRFIVYQHDFSLAEERAKESGNHLYQTGGSVATTALELGIMLKCGRIIFIGLDLSFPDKLAHAEETSRREIANTSGMRQVEGIDGKILYTNQAMDLYRKWMEDRIDGIKGIEIIDATEGGALIKGMKIQKLTDIDKEA